MDNGNVSIQILRQSAAMRLNEAGRPSAPIGLAPRLRGTDLVLPAGTAEAGIWECEPGSFHRQVAKAEVMHLLSGHCSFTPAGGEAIELRAGDTVFFPAHTQGSWVVHETVRKVYVTL